MGTDRTPLWTASHGRGGGYGRHRGALEAALRMLYRGGWPGRLWGLVPASGSVDRLELRLPLLPPAHPPLTVAFASDLHIGPTTASRTLDRARELLSRVEPDVLVLGGDYVFLDATEAVATRLAAWAEAVPAMTKLAVLGNHDLWTRHELIEEALCSAGVEVLVNQSLTLPAPHEDVAVVGLDDPWSGRPDLDEALGGAEQAATKVVVCHSSDLVDDVARRGAALYLTGHTHGGHIALPGYRPVVVPGRFGRRYPHGLHAVGDLALFVSRGVGGAEVPIRTFARPDVAVLTLAPSRPPDDRPSRAHPRRRRVSSLKILRARVDNRGKERSFECV